MKRRLVRLGLLAGLLVGTLWLGLLAAGNSEAAREELLAQARKRWPGEVQLAKIRMAWDLDVTLVGLKVSDRAGLPLLDVPVVEVDWRVPWGGRAPLVARVPSGRVEIHGPSWGLAPPSSPGFQPGFQGMPPGSLASAGTWKVPPEPLVDVDVREVSGLFSVPHAGIELPFTVPVVKAQVHTGGRVELHRLELRLAEAATLHANGKLTPRRAEVQLQLPRTSLADVSSLPPLPMLLVPFGLSPQGLFEGEVLLGTSGGRLTKAKGQVRFEQLAVRMGPEEMARDGAGSWSFQREGAGLAGDLVLDDLAFRMTGLPVRLRKAKGRLEVAPRLLRVARLDGKGPLGPVRGSYRLDLRRGYDWNLDLVVGGGAGSWLSGATVLAGPAGIRLEGVSLRGTGLDVILETGVLPDGIDPPTWRLEQAGVFGTVPGGPIQLRDLGGVLYLDNEGGHSFFLESDAGKFQGQITGDGGLKLWVKRSLSDEMRYLDLPASGS